MMHPQIEHEEIIERYVRNKLGEEERKAFEEHFFGCDDCFEKLQATERFVAGVRDAAHRGMLAGKVDVRTRGWNLSEWGAPAFAASACVALVLAVLSGWLYFIRMPRMREQLIRSAAEMHAQQQARAALEQQIANGVQAEVNLPLVMLQATRDVQAAPNEVTIPSGARQLVLWVEVPAGKSRSFRLQIDTADNRSVKKLDNLQRNSYGALAVSLPVEALQSGNYRITLTSLEPPPAFLVGEYRLVVRKP
jgi:anti-sigma factor RsiW